MKTEYVDDYEESFEAFEETSAALKANESSITSAEGSLSLVCAIQVDCYFIEFLSVS